MGGHPEEVLVYLSPGKGPCQVRLLCDLGQQPHIGLEHAASRKGLTPSWQPPAVLRLTPVGR